MILNGNINSVDKYNKWYNNYIEGINLDEIEWKKLNYNELIKFYYHNYFDDEYNSFVMTRNRNNQFLPFGMMYLTMDPDNIHDEYIVGLAKNKAGLQTIVACFTYISQYRLINDKYKMITYIRSVEVNEYFQNRGIFIKMLSCILDFINKHQDIVVAMERDMGPIIHITNQMKNYLMKNGFSGEICNEYIIDEMYLDENNNVKRKIL